MAQVSDSISATVRVNADGAIRDLRTLSRESKQTGSAFTQVSRTAGTAGQRTADGLSRANSASTKATSGFKGLQQSVSRASSSLHVFGAATAVVGTATAAIFAAANAASRLNEQVSGSRVTFGTASDSVQNFARTTATNIGLVRAETLKFTNQFGAFFKQAGFGQQSAAKMSTTLVQLAGDLASFRDVSLETSAAAISSGLAGEAEPLRRLGVDLRIAKVDAEALASGFATTKDAITETDRVAARYVSLLRQTRDAQTDAARTANEYANTQRRFNATLEDFKASAGQSVLPALTDMTQGLSLLIAAADRGTGPLKEAGVNVGDFLTAIGKGVASGGHLPVFLKSLGDAGSDTGDKMAAAAKVYDDALGKFGEGSPEATSAMAALRVEVDAAEQAATRSGQAFESTARAMSRMRSETEAAVGTLRGFVDAQRSSEDASDRVFSAHSRLSDAERELNDLRRKGAVDAEAVASAEQRVQDASQGTADARRRLSDAEESLNDLRRRGPVDAERVADAERSVVDATRSVVSARRSLIDAEKEIARLRAGPTGEESTDASRDITRAELALARAQQRLKDARAALGQPGDKADARLDVREAELSLAEATDQLREAQEAQIALQQRGLEGSEALREAEERAEEARYGLAEATRRQNEAESDARDARAGDPDYAKKIAELTRAVEGARRGVAGATRDENQAAEELRRAREGDPDFNRRLAAAVEAVRSATSDLRRAEEDLPGAAAAAVRSQEALNQTLATGSDEAYRLAQNLGIVAQAYRDMLHVRDAPLPLGPGIIADTRAAPPLSRREMGGPVTAGTPYIVGERRAELFVPNRNGYVHPQVPASSSGGSSVQLTVTAPQDAGLVAQAEYAARVAGWVLNPSGRR